MSARDKERVKLAELRAERRSLMLKQKQALRAAEENLSLEIEIAKAEVREQALRQMSEYNVLRRFVRYLTRGED